MYLSLGGLAIKARLHDVGWFGGPKVLLSTEGCWVQH